MEVAWNHITNCRHRPSWLRRTAGPATEPRRVGTSGFLFDREVRYQSVKGSRVLETGVGQTVEISSREVWFTTQHDFRRGQKIQLAVGWPVMLDHVCRLKLELSGWVIQSDRGRAAVKIERYEFRTCGAQLAKGWQDSFPIRRNEGSRAEKALLRGACP
jgi:hypothetical protein